jgi:hypothetical protein
MKKDGDLSEATVVGILIRMFRKITQPVTDGSARLNRAAFCFDKSTSNVSWHILNVKIYERGVDTQNSSPRSKMCF